MNLQIYFESLKAIGIVYMDCYDIMDSSHMKISGGSFSINDSF